jgi:hypothetical protein
MLITMGLDKMACGKNILPGLSDIISLRIAASQGLPHEQELHEHSH